MSDKAWIRNLNGAPVFLQEARGDEVAISVDGQDRVMRTSEWRALPPWSAAVSPIEARDIREIVREAARKWAFLKFDLRFGEDAAGEPAVWISFFIGPPFPTTTKDTGRLTEAGSEVKAALFAKGIDRIPYIGFHEQRAKAAG